MKDISNTAGFAWKKWALKAIGVFLFVWIFLKIDRAALAEQLKQTDPFLLVLACMTMFSMFVLRTAKWHYLVHLAGVTQSFFESWKWYNIGNFLGVVTPGKVGELGKAAQLSKHGVPMKTALGLTLLDRILDMSTMLFFAVCSAGFLIDPKWGLAGIPLFFAGILVVILFVQFNLIPAPIQKFIQPFFAVKFRTGDVIYIVVLSFVCWIVYFGWAYLLAQSIGIELSFILLSAVFALTSMASILGIAPIGLGTRDAALIFLLMPYGIVSAHAVALGLLMFSTILLLSFIGGFYYFRVN